MRRITVTEPVAAAAAVLAGGLERPGRRPIPRPAVLPGSSELSASSDPDRQFYRSVARIGIQVAEALEYANRQGILHRDIKPSNLLLDNRGNVWVADFGLAKTAEADDLTHTGDILGTIRYMAPERFAGQCDARSDVYSLGLTLYELVALRPAYEASDRHALIERVLHEEPERLKKLAPGVPRDLETIVAKAIARDPAGRYATAAALAEDLRRFVEDRPIRRGGSRRRSGSRGGAGGTRGWPSSIGLAAMALVAAVVCRCSTPDRQAEATAESPAWRAARERGRRAERGARPLEDRPVRVEPPAGDARSRARAGGLREGAGRRWDALDRRVAADGDRGGRRGRPARRPGQPVGLAAQPRRCDTDFSHNGGITAVAFSPDGKTIVTASWDLTVRLWDIATGEQLGPTIRHDGPVRGVSFSPDGRTLATASNDRTARLWDIASGKPIGPAMTHPAIVFAITYSPDGRTLATGCGDGGVRLWDGSTSRALGQLMRHSSLVWSVAFSPDGKIIASASWDNTARLWDVATRRQIGPRLEHTADAFGVAFSPDGKIVASTGRDRAVRFWDVATGRALGQPIVHNEAVFAVAFSPDGQSIVTGSDTEREPGMSRPGKQWVLGSDIAMRWYPWRSVLTVGRS